MTMCQWYLECSLDSAQAEIILREVYPIGMLVERVHGDTHWIFHCPVDGVAFWLEKQIVLSRPPFK